MNRIVVVCEDEPDFRAARILADRVLMNGVEWLRDQNLDDFRDWTGLDESRPYLVWKSLREDVRRTAPREPKGIFGKFAGESGAPDAWAARFALLAIAGLSESPAAVILLRDADSQQNERRRGLEQGRASLPNPPPFAVVVGLADPKREAWILAGFSPKTDDERRRLADLRRQLTFDPTREPNRLRGRHDERDIKRVVKTLANDSTREDGCLQEIALDEIGPDVGLREFVDELRSWLVPAFEGERTA